VRISVPVNHNFYEESPIRESVLGDAFSTNKSGAKMLRNMFSAVYELRLGDEHLKQIKIFNLKRKKLLDPDSERLILKLYSRDWSAQEREYYIQTGLYAGVLFHKGCKFNITTKYGETFLKRMLNFVNDVYVDTEQLQSKPEDSKNPFLFIVAYLFLQSLEKATVIGLPQEYRELQQRSHKVRGRIDIAKFLKRDIPFRGKLTTTYRDRLFVQEIVDVLYLTLHKLGMYYGVEIHNRILGLHQLIKQNHSGRAANYDLIQSAKNHQVLSNPLYSNFRNVLEYAEILLLDKELISDGDPQKLATSGYLFDIAELFELYLEKLLTRHFPEWSVNGQEELPIYQNQFYSRSMFPDLVMRHRGNGSTIVLDAKFKQMNFRNQDVDRTDLHQIHSYSGYFKDQLISSGLIYPLSSDLDIEMSHSNSIYGTRKNATKFIVDGIYVSENQSLKELIKSEEAFISRISNIIYQDSLTKVEVGYN